MERPRWKPSLNTLLFVAAAALGAVAYWGVTRHVAAEIDRERQTQAQRFALEPMIVAARDLPAGRTLDANALAVRSMPRAYVPQDAIRGEDPASLLGRVLRQAVRAGDLLVPAVLVSATAPPFSEQVEQGRRAVTVPVDEVSAFDGLLSPGDHVDLLYAHAGLLPGTASARGPAVKVLLESVPVLATGRATRRTLVQGPDGSSQAVDSSFSTATLSVTPAEAQLITLAQRTGELVATLRHPQDSAALGLAPLDILALEGRSPRERVPRALPHAMELITGGRGGLPTIQRLAVAPLRNP